MGQLFERAGAVQSAVIAQPCMAKKLRAFAHPVPGILLELADVFLDHDRDEELHRLEADAIHPRRGTKHSGGLHAQSPQALLAIAQGSVDEGYLFHVTSGDSKLAFGLVIEAFAALTNGSIGVMEWWSIGFGRITPILQYSTTPGFFTHYSILSSLCRSRLR
jgi:hypothetical protein